MEGDFIIRNRWWDVDGNRHDEFLHDCRVDGCWTEDVLNAKRFPSYDVAKERAEALTHKGGSGTIEAVWLGSYGHLQVDRGTTYQDKGAQWQNNIQVFCEVLNHHEYARLDGMEPMPNNRFRMTVLCACGNTHAFIITPGLPELKQFP